MVITLNLPKESYGKKTFWLRLGDNAEYEAGSLDSHLNLLQEAIPDQTLRRITDYGVACDSFQNLNYISFFVGDEEAQPIRELTDHELLYLNYWLSR